MLPSPTQLSAQYDEVGGRKSVGYDLLLAALDGKNFGNSSSSSELVEKLDNRHDLIRGRQLVFDGELALVWFPGDSSSYPKTFYFLF